MVKEGIKQHLLAHPIVIRLLNNPNWEPAARAAVAEFVDGKKCPVTSWRKSSTWQQVKMVFDEMTEGTEDRPLQANRKNA